MCIHAMAYPSSEPFTASSKPKIASFNCFKYKLTEGKYSLMHTTYIIWQQNREKKLQQNRENLGPFALQTLRQINSLGMKHNYSHKHSKKKIFLNFRECRDMFKSDLMSN